MTKAEAIDILVGCIEAHSEEENEALDMAIEALKREDHDGCDGCRYEANHELSLPCVGCKQNYVDKYVPMPEHDREWIIGCIKHDGFVKTDRRDKANQIILDALSADRPRPIDPTCAVDPESGVVPISACEPRGPKTIVYEDKPRGEWNDIGGVIRWGCSLCHYAYDQKFNFCPNCGADMRGKETDES